MNDGVKKLPWLLGSALALAAAVLSRFPLANQRIGSLRFAALRRAERANRNDRILTSGKAIRFIIQVLPCLGAEPASVIRRTKNLLFHSKRDLTHVSSGDPLTNR